VNFLDVVIVAVLVSSVIGGWQVGLFAGATAWVLLVQGLVAPSNPVPPS